MTGDDLLVVATAVAALASVACAPLWRPARHLLTIVHEGAHGVAALLCGRQLRGIRLHSDTSGLTVSRGRPRGPGMVVTVGAGYLGPSVLGLVAAVLLRADRPVAVWWVVLALLALLLVQIRNWYGLRVVLVAGSAAFAVAWWAGARTQEVAAYLVTWFLLLGAPRAVLELHRERRRRRVTTSDADQLARLTHVPGLVWVGLFLLGTLGSTLLGAALLLPAART